ncbi:MAG TPA: aminoacyl-tRNA hydrolase, partial [Bacillales bacterium]|nr:aminoacyl-tRNA hydrolase [Bacillales bacterium]
LIAHLGTKEFNRIRIGIDHPSREKDVIDYVLKPFSKNEKEVIEEACDRASEACLKWTELSFLEVMNAFNG